MQCKHFLLKKLKDKGTVWNQHMSVKRQNNNLRGWAWQPLNELIMQHALALTCWGSPGRTDGQGIHNGSCVPSQEPQYTAAGQTHGSCQNCLVGHWHWGRRTLQSEECRPAAYWSPLTASSKRGKRRFSGRHPLVFYNHNKNKQHALIDSNELCLGCTCKESAIDRKSLCLLSFDVVTWFLSLRLERDHVIFETKWSDLRRGIIASRGSKNTKSSLLFLWVHECEFLFKPSK